MPRGDSRDERLRRLAAAGHDVHSEASFVAGYRPGTVLDAGCGTGRIAVELARRGVKTVGVDADRVALDAARQKSSRVRWIHADLTTLHITRRGGEPVLFHMVVAAGNLMISLTPGTEKAVVTRLAAHLVPGGLLVAGFQLVSDRYSLVRYDDDCAAAGLEATERFASWTRDQFRIGGGYVVAVHQKPVS